MVFSLIALAVTGLRAESAPQSSAQIKVDSNRSNPVAAAKTKAQLNSPAPDFDLPNTSGEMVRLSSFRGKQPVVVYFYPKDETKVCTAEACAFRDSYEDFKKEGAEVIGISSDPASSHKQFAANHNLPFILLSDEGGKVRSAWGVPLTMGILPGRVTYVIDKQGMIRLMFESQTQANRHIEEAKKALAKLKSE
jgi:peroxiredoxin Q/BCP